jgi:hypothetical protein
MDLLLARSALTGFIGRQDVWDDCLAWCHAPDTVSIRCITGPSGSGKTRLALELVHHLRALADWDARFVEFFILEPFDLWAKTYGRNHVLLVFDQAGDVIGALATSLCLLANEPPQNAQRKLRVLLLARHADWDEGWLSALQPRSAIQEPVRDLFHPEQPIRLGPLPEADCLALYKQAMQAAAVLTNLPQPPDPRPDIFTRSRSREALRDPLSLIMAAVTAVRSAVPDPFALTRLELAYELAASLARSMDGAFPENPQIAHHMAAYVTLSGGLSRDQTQDALEVEARSNSLGVVLNPGGFVDRLRTWLPGEQTDLGPIQPDIIGEAFILGAKVPLLRKPEETLLRALTERREPVLRLLIRIAQDFCLAEKNPRQEPLEWLQRIIEKGLADDFTLLRDIEEALPDSTVVLQKHAAVVTTLMIQRLSAMILKNAGQGTNLRTIVESAAMLNNLGNRLSRLGVREEALSSAVDSVEVYRELILVDRKVFLPGFATALSTLANARDEMGLLDDALPAVQESVALWRELAADRESWLRNFAISLTILANRQVALGLLEDASSSASEAVSLCREAVARDRDAFLPDLAHALSILAAVQLEQELHTEGRASAAEAVQFGRELAQRNRDAHLPALANALGILSTAESQLGLDSQSVSTAQESVTILGELADYSAASFLRDLAHALDSLSLKQSHAGQPQEALASAHAGNRIYRALAGENAGAFLSELATSLINLGKAQGEAGQPEQSLATVQEAVAATTELVSKNRCAFLYQQALALNNLTAVQTAQGLWDDVLKTRHPALFAWLVALWRELAADRESWLRNFAISLTILANRQVALGLLEDASSSASEAVSLFRAASRQPSLQ